MEQGNFTRLLLPAHEYFSSAHYDFEIQESSRAYSKSHLKLRNFTLLAYKGLHTTSLHSFHSECVSKQIRAACLYLPAFVIYPWSITGDSWSCRQLLRFIFCHQEKGWCLVLSAQGIVCHCIPVMTVPQAQ